MRYFIAVLAAATAFAADLTIVEAGRSKYVIVTPARASPPEQFAAAELQSYLQRVSGARIPVVPAPRWRREPCICVGAVIGAPAVKARYSDDDAFSVRVIGSNVHLVGANARGTLSAAYEFLRLSGVRFFAPGYKFYKGLHESVPRHERLTIDTKTNLSVEPAFKRRGEYPEHSFIFEPDDVIALMDWSAKNGINYLGFRQNEFTDAWYRVVEPEARRRGLIIGAAGHGYERFLPRDRYFGEHPEWFALTGGKRSDAYFDQFCTSNQEAMGEFRKNLTSFVRDYPALSFMSAMPNDSPRWCECDRCKAEKLTPRERLFRMNELVSKTVYEANPKMTVEVSAGIQYFGVAANEFFTSSVPNMTYRTGVLRRCLRHAWNDPSCKTNKPQYDIAVELTKKIASKGTDVVWTSRYSSFREQSIPGILYPEQMAAELRDLNKVGGSGVFYCYSTPADWIPYELKHYLYARLLVNPDQPVDQFLSAYYKERFPGSPDAVASFYTALRTAAERYDHPGGGYTRDTQFGFYPPDQFERAAQDFAAAREAIQAAERTNQNPKERQLLWLLNASLQYGEARVQIDRLAQSGKREEAVARTKKLMDLVESWDGRGVFYDSVFLRRGLEFRFGGIPRDMPMKRRPPSNSRVYEYMGDDRRAPE